MLRFLIAFFSFSFSLLYAQQQAASQRDFPKDYFGSPLDIPLSYAGNFCELRPNHFHGGLDIKTDGKEGLKVYAAAEGFVSCIKVSTYGYGKVMYIDHPNGYTTVYAHLQKFAPEIEKFVKERQYLLEKYDVEIEFKPTDFPVKKGDWVALSGNTGGSAGPHLHYEIRDTQTTNAYNPLLFGYPNEDDIAPLVYKFVAYPIGEESAIEGIQEERNVLLGKDKNTDEYLTSKITAQGRIGLGVYTLDKMIGTRNSYGVYKISLWVNGSEKLSYTFDELIKGEDPYLNTLIDYPLYVKTGARVQHLYREPQNKLSIYTTPQESDGIIQVEDGMTYLVEVKIEDFNKNTTTLNLTIEGKKEPITGLRPESKGTPLVAKRDHMYKTENMSVYIPEDTFFQDTFIEVKQNGDTLSVLAPTQPLKNQYNIVFDASKYTQAQLPYVCVASVKGKDSKKYYQYTYRKDNIVSAKVKTLGRFVLTTDTKAPVIKPLNFSKVKNNIAKLDKLKVSVTDDFSGIGKFSATINGKWVLMEYEHKDKTLTFTLADRYFTPDEDYTFELTVSDKVGNESVLTIPLVYKP